MPLWEDFEIDCTKYLNSKFKEYAIFEWKGSTNSTIPDILVTTNSGKVFYIDAKHSPAQCGQFVLFPDLETMTFKYSEANTKPINPYSEKIIEYMNTDFEKFENAGTKGENICFPEDSLTFANWIIQTYREKGVKFIITNEYEIIRLEDLLSYFEIKAKYRIKRSGSCKVGQSKINKILEYVYSKDYKISDHTVDKGKLFVKSSQNLHKQRFIYEENEYMFSSKDNFYEIRKLSNTYNANVIFSIDRINKEKSGLSDNEFISALK